MERLLKFRFMNHLCSYQISTDNSLGDFKTNTFLNLLGLFLLSNQELKACDPWV